MYNITTVIINKTGFNPLIFKINPGRSVYTWFLFSMRILTKFTLGPFQNSLFHLSYVSYYLPSSFLWNFVWFSPFLTFQLSNDLVNNLLNLHHHIKQNFQNSYSNHLPSLITWHMSITWMLPNVTKSFIITIAFSRNLNNYVLLTLYITQASAWLQNLETFYLEFALFFSLWLYSIYSSLHSNKAKLFSHSRRPMADIG